MCHDPLSETDDLEERATGKREKEGRRGAGTVVLPDHVNVSEEEGGARDLFLSSWEQL